LSGHDFATIRATVPDLFRERHSNPSHPFPGHSCCTDQTKTRLNRVFVLEFRAFANSKGSGTNFRCHLQWWVFH
jgi:hypothetical protein